MIRDLFWRQDIILLIPTSSPHALLQSATGSNPETEKKTKIPLPRCYSSGGGLLFFQLHTSQHHQHTPFGSVSVISKNVLNIFIVVVAVAVFRSIILCDLFRLFFSTGVLL